MCFLKRVSDFYSGLYMKPIYFDYSSSNLPQAIEFYEKRNKKLDQVTFRVLSFITFSALEFISHLILSFRSQTLTLRFSLKISLFTKQNTFLRSSILNNFSI